MKFKTLGLLSLALLMMAGCGGANPTTGGEPSTTDPTSTLPEITKEVINEDMPDNHQYKLGDQMYDFTIKNVDGEERNLIQTLETKKAVMINFWASWCGPCKYEFPFLQEGYAANSDDFAIFAISTEPADGKSTILGFKETYGLTFDLFMSNELMYAFNNICGGEVPISVIIDRYGTISYVHKGCFMSVEDVHTIIKKYTADDYYPDPIDPENPSNPSISDEPTSVPTIEMPDSSVIENAINDSSYPYGYYEPDGDDGANNWPWLVNEEEGYIYPSNTGIDNSWSIIQSTFRIDDVESQVLTFDYYSSTETNYDKLYIQINGLIVKEISGLSGGWKTCYAYVATEPGEYELSLTYLKDSEGSQGEDTIRISNMRFELAAAIDVPTYVKRDAATNKVNGKYTNYVDIFYNEEDGYYHVNSVNGPLLLAELRLETNWRKDASLYAYAYNEEAVVDGVDYKDIITEFANYASNSTNGLTPITKELKEAMVALCNEYGTNPSENHFLECCYYISAYGTDGVEYPSPITGLALFDAYLMTENEPLTIDYFTPIMPRGKYASFTPSKTGVYRFYTNETTNVNGFVFDAEGNQLSESTQFYYENIIRETVLDYLELYCYLEAGVEYLVRTAFSNPEETGRYIINNEYIGDSYQRLVVCSVPYFTTDSDQFDTDEGLESNVISVGIDVKKDDDGYYREVKKDGSLGSYVYTDFLHYNSLFYGANGQGLTFKDIVELGGFDFTNDNFDNAVSGKDCSELVLSYCEASEATDGLMKVTDEIKDLLQGLMDKYTFAGVEGSWLKLCYYYEVYSA